MISSKSEASAQNKTSSFNKSSSKQLQTGKNVKNQRSSEDDMPAAYENYLQSTDFNNVLNGIVNQVLSEKPKDPLNAMAILLNKKTIPQYPQFDSFKARRHYLNDRPGMESLRLQIFLRHKGRTVMAYQTVFAFDDEERAGWLYDDQQYHKGLKQAIKMVNGDLNDYIKKNIARDEPLNLDTLREIDTALVNFFNQKIKVLSQRSDTDSNSQRVLFPSTQSMGSMKSPPRSQHSAQSQHSSQQLSQHQQQQQQADQRGLNLIRMISEALVQAVAIKMTNSDGDKVVSYRKLLNLELKPTFASSMKYIIRLLDGGNSIGSVVKFSRFYLIIDPDLCSSEELNTFLNAFFMAFRKMMTNVRGGEQAFKADFDAPAFNAFLAISDSFKYLQEALDLAYKSLPQTPPMIINSAQTSSKNLQQSSKNLQQPSAKQSQAQFSHNQFVTSLPGTNQSQNEIKEPVSLISQEHLDIAMRKPVRLGVCCDGNANFNTEPKDPNKYAVEGSKAPYSSQQMVEYYMDFVEKYPYLTFIEDPFADQDLEGYRLFKMMLKAKYPQVQVCRRFHNFETLENTTTWDPLTPEELNQHKEIAAQIVEEKEGEVLVQDVPLVVGNKNANKYTPDIASFRCGKFVTSSELQNILTYRNSMKVEDQFQLMMDDRTCEENQQEDEKIKMAQGFGINYYCLKGNITRAFNKIKKQI